VGCAQKNVALRSFLGVIRDALIWRLRCRKKWRQKAARCNCWRPHAAVFTAINHLHRGKWCLFPVEIKQIMHRKLANENNDAREKEMRAEGARGRRGVRVRGVKRRTYMYVHDDNAATPVLSLTHSLTPLNSVGNNVTTGAHTASNHAPRNMNK
jgi:hypothetical protein